ncbi:hypothetical protein VCCP1035_1968B, partial [Vibrio cholerae CP1035(8)]
HNQYHEEGEIEEEATN